MKVEDWGGWWTASTLKVFPLDLSRWERERERASNFQLYLKRELLWALTTIKTSLNEPTKANLLEKREKKKPNMNVLINLNWNYLSLKSSWSTTKTRISCESSNRFLGYFYLASLLSRRSEPDTNLLNLNGDTFIFWINRYEIALVMLGIWNGLSGQKRLWADQTEKKMEGRSFQQVFVSKRCHGGPKLAVHRKRE